MNISKNQVDALNAIVTVAVTKEDYSANVEQVLTNYKKNASIPGFRKGAVPMSLIKKQYEKAVIAEEVNKLLQKSLNDYLVEEKLDILGSPLPKITEDLNWDSEELKFEFELGLTPEFDVNLSNIKGLTQYKVIADDVLINEQIERIQKQFGKVIPQEEVTEESEVYGEFINEDAGINAKNSITVTTFADKKVFKALEGKKVGEVITLKTNGLVDDEHKLMNLFNLDHEAVHGLDVEVAFTISNISKTERAELNQELFDKLFGEGNVTSEADLKNKIKEDAENQFVLQADQKFLNDVTDYLVKNTSFELPAEFLKKWIQSAGENPLSAEQAEVEFAKSENGLRYQLIENKVITGNDLQIKFEDLKDYTSGIIKNQMAQFGQLNPTEEEVDSIVTRVLSNQDEVKRVSEQVMSTKLVSLFKEKINAEIKEVTYSDFIKVMYGEM